MPERQMFSRWDPLNPTNAHAGMLLGWAFGVYHRPFLPYIIPAYSRFDDQFPWPIWGWSALIIALALLFTPRSSGWRLAAHALAAAYWGACVTAFTSGVGIIPGSILYSVLLAQSVILFARTAVHWQSQWRWWRRMVDDPPRWLRWLAGIGEFDASSQGKERG